MYWYMSVTDLYKYYVQCTFHIQAKHTRMSATINTHFFFLWRRLIVLIYMYMYHMDDQLNWLRLLHKLALMNLHFLHHCTVIRSTVKRTLKELLMFESGTPGQLVMLKWSMVLLKFRSFIHWLGHPVPTGSPMGLPTFFFCLFCFVFFLPPPCSVPICCEENNGLGWNFAEPYLWTCFRSR